MNKQKAIQASSPPPRFAKERGATVTTSKSAIRLHDGTSATSIGIDISQATCPDRSYHAELAGVVYENGTVKLLFGQETRNKKVRSLIEVSMSPRSVIQALNAFNVIKHPSFEEIVLQMGEKIPTLYKFDEDPPEVARLKANMLSMSADGTEASIDFFDASPFTMANLQQNSSATSVNIVGVVRIDTQTALVHALLLGLRKLSSQFPPQITKLMEV